MMQWTGKKRERDKSRTLLLDIIDRMSITKLFFLWVLFIIIFATAQFAITFIPGNELVRDGMPITQDRAGFLGALYFSASSAIGTGFVDVMPEGIAGRSLAILEGLLSVLLLAAGIIKLVGIKQDRILEEIYGINYEEAFTNYRRGLQLVRTDITILMEKIEGKRIKQREIKDLWIIFSGLDQNLTNIKNFIIPSKSDPYPKKLDIAKLELILSSMKLSMQKVLELVKVLKNQTFEWRDELLLTSIYYDIQVVREIVDFEMKKSVDRKVIDKLNALRIILDETEAELRETRRQDQLVTKHEDNHALTAFIREELSTGKEDYRPEPMTREHLKDKIVETQQEEQPKGPEPAVAAGTTN